MEGGGAGAVALLGDNELVNQLIMGMMMVVVVSLSSVMRYNEVFT